MHSHTPESPRALLDRALARVAFPACRSVVEHYFTARLGDIVAARRSIDPGVLGSALPHVILIDVRSPNELSVRLAGTAFRQGLKREITGTNWLDLRPGQYRAIWAALVASLLERPCGAYFHTIEQADYDVSAEYVLLPLRSRASETPDMLVGAAVLRPGPADRPAPRAPLHDGIAFIDLGRGVPTAPAKVTARSTCFGTEPAL